MQHEDPFKSHPPCFTSAAKAILNGVKAAIKDMERSATRENRFHREAVPASNNYKTVFRKPVTQQSIAEAAKAPLHHYVFCSHEIPYWRPCAKCGRDKALAKRNAELVLKGISGGAAAFFTK